MGIDRFDLADNPEPRCPCVLLLDTSGSMFSENRIGLLNEGIRAFKDGLTTDALAQQRVEVAIITFGGEVQVVQDFVSASKFQPPTLHATGGTPMGEGIERALDLIEDGVKRFRDAGLGIYRPWLFLITDGEPTDNYTTAAKLLHDRAAKKKVAAFAVGVGDGANMTKLKEISPRTPVRLQGLKFVEMFEWLSRSMTSVSHSGTPDGKGDGTSQVALDPITDWGTP